MISRHHYSTLISDSILVVLLSGALYVTLCLYRSAALKSFFCFFTQSFDTVSQFSLRFTTLFLQTESLTQLNPTYATQHNSRNLTQLTQPNPTHAAQPSSHNSIQLTQLNPAQATQRQNLSFSLFKFWPTSKCVVCSFGNFEVGGIAIAYDENIL